MKSLSARFALLLAATAALALLADAAPAAAPHAAKPRPKPLGEHCKSSGPECASGCCVRAQCTARSVCFPPAPAPPPAEPLATGAPPAWIISGCKHPNQIHLTFDDGPLPPYTPQILDMLSSRGASATFFVIGSYLANNPQARELLKRAHDEGHCIADHTMLHPDMTSIPIERARSEILETADRIKGVIGRYPRLFRFPFGSSNQALLDLAAELGFASIGWNVDPQDWQEISQDEYRGYLREGLGWFEQYGYVSITHDYKSSAPGILRSLFEEIDARKLQIVDAQTCFAMPCYAD